MGLIITVPSGVDFRNIVKNPAIEGVRLNTTLPVAGTIEDTLQDMRNQTGPKDFWIDLKCRQLRIVGYSVDISNNSEIHYIKLSHKIKTNIPTDIWLDDGNYSGEIKDIINDDTLVVPSIYSKKEGLMLINEGKLIRPGMSINILDKSLSIDGYLTNKDKSYIDAAKNLGLQN